MMDGWWDELHNEICELLTVTGPADPNDLAKVLGMSTGAVCSCLAMLAAEGRVRIGSVEAVPRRQAVAPAA